MPGGCRPRHRSDLRLPEDRARLRVDRVDPAVERRVEGARAPGKRDDRGAGLRRRAEVGRLPGGGPRPPARSACHAVHEVVVRGHEDPVRARPWAAPPWSRPRPVKYFQRVLPGTALNGRPWALAPLEKLEARVLDEDRVAVGVAQVEARVRIGLRGPRASEGWVGDAAAIAGVRRVGAGRAERRLVLPDADLGRGGRHRVQPLQAIPAAVRGDCRRPRPRSGRPPRGRSAPGRR